MTGPTPDAVAALLRPASVAIVGASDRSRWSGGAFENLTGGGFRGPVHLVNRRGGTVHGRTAAESCAALGSAVDLGVVLVPAPAVPDALRDLAAAGARSAVVLTSGFAETGPAGAAAQRELAAAAHASGVTLLGPNCLGFINFVDGAKVWTTPVRAPSRPSGVALVSQSGATALFLCHLASQQDVGLSYVVSTGNEADLDVGSFVRHLADDPDTRAVALFIETVREPERFLAAIRHALDRGKPVVALKVGASEATARAAEAHTGALVGDDGVFDGICREFGIIRTRSIEELLATADIVGRTGVLRPGGLCVISNSGGICEIAADTAAARGVALPEVPPRAVAELRSALPDYGTPHNPLDTTGGIEPEQCERAIRILAAEERYAAILCPWYEIPRTPEDVSPRLTALHSHLARGLNDIPIPGLLVSYTGTVVTDHSLAIVADTNAPYLACGLDRAISGLAGAMWWSDRYRSRGRPLVEGPPAVSRARPSSEHEALAYLRSAGVPVVPATLAASEAEAVAAARALDGAAVLKIASPDIAHKSDIGGVALNLRGDAAVAAAFRSVTSAAMSARPDARLDGVLVSPMRERGVELLVGCSRDPQWGLVVAVGLGGVWVEVLRDVSLRLLPVGPAEVRRMLAELRGAKLLEGQRGVPAADLDAVAEAVSRIGTAALRLGPALRTLEVNPLWVRGGQVEALDAVVVWDGEAERVDEPPTLPRRRVAGGASDGSGRERQA